jgi:predicted ester cyclase
MIKSKAIEKESESVEEKNKAIVRRFMEAYNNRELEIFDELVAEDYIDHVFEQRGREYLKQLFTMAFEAFPDWYEAIEDIIAEGDKVWVLVKATGTHTGEWDLFGAKLPPTGKKTSIMMVFIWRLENGQLVEGWEVDDNLEFLRQLGVVDYTEKGKPIENVFK